MCCTGASTAREKRWIPRSSASASHRHSPLPLVDVFENVGCRLLACVWTHVRVNSAPVRSLTEGWVIKVWEKQMTEEGQTRVRFTRSKEGVKARGWASLKAKNGKRLLYLENES